MRTLLIVVGILLSAIALVAASGWYWWHVHGDSVIASGRAAAEQGRRRGAAVDESACLREVLERQRTDRGGSLVDDVSRSIWLQGCLETSRPAASFCQGVPAPDRFIELTVWISAACNRQGVADPGCQSLQQRVATYCASPGRAAKVARS